MARAWCAGHWENGFTWQATNPVREEINRAEGKSIRVMWCDSEHMWNYNGHMGWGWMGVWWIIIAVLMCVFAWYVISVVRKKSDQSARESPEEAIKRRYANGEIDRETYQRVLEDLRK